MPDRYVLLTLVLPIIDIYFSADFSEWSHSTLFFQISFNTVYAIMGVHIFVGAVYRLCRMADCCYIFPRISAMGYVFCAIISAILLWHSISRSTYSWTIVGVLYGEYFLGYPSRALYELPISASWVIFGAVMYLGYLCTLVYLSVSVCL